MCAGMQSTGFYDFLRKYTGKYGYPGGATKGAALSSGCQNPSGLLSKGNRKHTRGKGIEGLVLFVEHKTLHYAQNRHNRKKADSTMHTEKTKAMTDCCHRLQCMKETFCS